MNVMLLAAGRSTRLGPLGLALPKPLVPICGYPPIAFGLAACAHAGLRQAVVNVFHHGDRLQETLGDGSAYGVRLFYSRETELLGTGGGIAKARVLFGPGPVLVMNAKVVAALDLPTLSAAHEAGRGVATMLLRDDPDPHRWGAIAVDATGRVVEILNRRSPIPAEGPVTARMFTGVHIVEPALLDRLTPRPCDVIRDAYIPALEAGARIMAALLPGYFAEHSTPERYLAGNLALLADPSLVPHAPGALVGIDPGAAVAAAAVVSAPVRIQAGATVEPGAHVGPGVVVGTGARVCAGVRLQRAVVWPGAVASQDAINAVVTTDGVVPIA